MLFESWSSRRNRNMATKDRLHAATVPDEVSDDDRGAIKEYTLNSTNLNHRLIEGKKLRSNQQQTHEAIKRLASPIGENLKLYSGSRTDFGKLGKESKDGILHSPAHLSTTHNFEKASEFSKGFPKHMVVIHAKAHNKGIHVSGLGAVPSEQETIIPAGTKLKYSHSSERNIDVEGHGRREKYLLHHFTIHSQ